MPTFQGCWEDLKEIIYVEEPGSVSGTQEALGKNSFRVAAWHSLATLPAFECIHTEEIGSDLGFVAPGADAVDSESSLSPWREKSAFKTLDF